MQMARVYERLFQLTNEQALRKTAAALVEEDVLTFSKWTAFVQHLTNNYPMLSTCSIDYYVANSYVPQLLIFYQQINAEGYSALLKKVAGLGVDTRALQSTINALLHPQQEMQPQAQMQMPMLGADTDTINPA